VRWFAQVSRSSITRVGTRASACSPVLPSLEPICDTSRTRVPPGLPAPMPLRAVFIDAGNTLLYEKPSRFEIYALAARRRGLDLSAERMTELMRKAHRELPREIDGAFRYSEGWFSSYIERIFHDGLDLSRSELSSVRDELFAQFSDPRTFQLFPGGLELLDALRVRGLGVGIISNWSQRLPGILDGLGISERVDFVLASAIERVEKPAPEIFARACLRAGVEPRQAIHVGDDVDKDVRGARAAGLLAVRIDHAGGPRGGIANDPATGAPLVGSLWELSDWIAQVA
jgi:putative hydrolase of the HAD superfamily